jgi:hypothetical protein
LETFFIGAMLVLVAVIALESIQMDLLGDGEMEALANLATTPEQIESFLEKLLADLLTGAR